MDERVEKVELEVAQLKGSLDWAKIVAAIIVTITVGGFAIIINIVSNTRADVFIQLQSTNNKIDALSARLSEEFRAQRQDLNAQTSALANAITATKLMRPHREGPADTAPSETPPQTNPQK